MYVPQILMCLFLSMFLEVMLLSNIGDAANLLI
ncbi:hypothetical protein HmCmsJML034_04527 [Escherichia coli]|nr:hypothetical protein HmCmsJML034_03043 [Escherichia coli]GCU71146.1 hypothetical protein HmCmsJML034_04527 [Escherichia coli]